MIDPQYFLIIVFVLAMGTFSIRASIIALSSKVKISDRVKQLFSFIPVSILPAFVAPAVFFHQGHTPWLFEKERLVILIFASIVCYFTRSTLATISFGLIALFMVS